MIQQSDISWQTQSWQYLLQHVITDAGELYRILGLDTSTLPSAGAADQDFPLRVPLPFVQRMQRGDPADPLLLQVLSSDQERLETPGYSIDPLGEQASNPLSGLLHKYRNRALVTLSSSCAVHCRYCFRRHFDYRANNGGRRAWPAILEYLADNPDIEEVILSGGDPLMAGDAQLRDFIEQLTGISSVRHLRIHTRLPVVIPQRILQAELDWLGIFPNPVVVLHINHANEIDDQLAAAVRLLRQAGATVLNQAVLLAQVNDSLEAQIALARQLTLAGILPYYLHLPDRVSGTAHFDVSRERGEAIVGQMRDLLSGYMVPRLVMEQSGAPSKLVLV